MRLKFFLVEFRQIKNSGEIFGPAKPKKSKNMPIYITGKSDLNKNYEISPDPDTSGCQTRFLSSWTT